MNRKQGNKLRYELLTMMAADSFASSFGIFTIIAVVTFVFWGLVNDVVLILWASSITFILSIRTLLVNTFIKHKTYMELEKFEFFYKNLTTFSALIISAGIVYLFNYQEPTYQVFLIMVVTGSAAGAVMSLAYYKRLIRLYLIIIIVPVTFILYYQHSPVSTPLSALMLFFLVMLSIFASKYNAKIINTLKNKQQMIETKKELKVSNNNYISVFNEVPISVFTYDKNLILISANRAFSQMLKTPEEKLKNLDLKILRDQSLREDFEKPFKAKKGSYEGVYTTHIANIEIWIRLNTVPMYDRNGTIIAGLGMVEDITKQMKYQEELRYRAFYDSLTGLTNREALTQQLKYFMSKLERSHKYGVLLFIDLDNFKNINDSLGHHIGDGVLKIFAKKVQKILREEDIFARLGGDEFVILIAQTENDIERINEIALNISDKIHKALKQSIQIETHTLYITLSLGIKILHPDEKNINTILKHADIAMYQSKNSGKNRTSFYDTEISKRMNEQLILHNELKNAIKNQEFELYLQPIVDLRSKKIVSAEALIRWNHPTKGLLYPDAFIEYAESSNLIIEIGKWVVERSFEIYKSLENELEDIAINISLKQFYQEDFVVSLLEGAKKHAVAPKHIKLELTESLALKNLDETIQKMLLLKSHGFIFSMDDFGTGYSSLSYLKNLPFDYIKIDQSFIRFILESDSDKTLVKIIIDVAKQFHLLVIAEGVETDAHEEFITKLHCDYAQGYYTSRPLPLQDFKKLLP